MLEILSRRTHAEADFHSNFEIFPTGTFVRDFIGDNFAWDFSRSVAKFKAQERILHKRVQVLRRNIFSFCTKISNLFPVAEFLSESEKADARC